MTSLKKAIQARRSCRDFQPKGIPQGILQRLLDAGQGITLKLIA